MKKNKEFDDLNWEFYSIENPTKKQVEQYAQKLFTYAQNEQEFIELHKIVSDYSDIAEDIAERFVKSDKPFLAKIHICFLFAPKRDDLTDRLFGKGDSSAKRDALLIRMKKVPAINYSAIEWICNKNNDLVAFITRWINRRFEDAKEDDLDTLYEYYQLCKNMNIEYSLALCICQLSSSNKAIQKAKDVFEGRKDVLNMLSPV